MNAVEPVSISTHSLRRSSREWRAPLVVLTALGAVVAASLATGAGSPPARTEIEAGRTPAYDVAMASVLRANHLLEETQTTLANARRSGARASVVVNLQRDVTSLEREYAETIAALAAASRSR